MIELIGVHRVNEAHVVGVPVKIWNRVGHPDSVLAMLRPFARGAHELWRAGSESKSAAF